ncbi:hypothetical protein Atai01_15780 [Amycolatopsis taiwanensis]|uniref:Uncharacterized protein n=1 Tax=Amycolatopsis taiwanensis TaxID=342230 RepID=A0A9W6VFK4_9PSEU|nr:hypothetical protein Atai01_15780 [Amycolatopsis taiwanensis]
MTAIDTPATRRVGVDRCGRNRGQDNPAMATATATTTDIPATIHITVTDDTSIPCRVAECRTALFSPRMVPNGIWFAGPHVGRLVT